MRSLDEIETFTAVIEHGSFTRAAAALHIGKSAVSKQIAKLEDRLGAQLLNRTTRKISTTEVGRAFYDRCRQIVSDLGDAERAVQDLQVEPRGLLRVNAPMSFGTMYLAEAVAEFMAEHHDLSIELDLSDRLVDVVEEGYDLAIRITRLPDSTLIARKIAPFERVICASPAYWRKHGWPARPADLASHNCLKYSYLSNRDEWMFYGEGGPYSVKISGNLMANNGEALRAAAIAGQGILNSPLFIVAEALNAGLLECVFRDHSDVDHAVYAVYPHSRHLSAKVRAFVDFLARRFSAPVPWRAGH